MAKFVLAGKTDCPYYAKAELLADKLQRSLPNFRVHKISIHPDRWQEWLQATCQRRGWNHEQSPLIWRELVNQGGKGTLLGGFSHFLEHCQEYYGVTSDMSSDMMQSIAAENLRAQMCQIMKERHRLGLIRPLHIWITCALNPTCYLLIPHLLCSEMFPHISAISLHLLDVEGNEDDLQALRVETEALAAPLLHQVSIHTDLGQAFQEADVILLLEERWPDSEEEKTKRILARYREYGQLMNTRANKEVKVIVSGDSLVNLRCSLLLDSAQSIDNRHFVAVATQLEHEAQAIIAKKLKVRTSDIKDVIVWGNISGSFYIDLQRAKVVNYEGAIKGPPSFSQPVLKLLFDRKWLKEDFQILVSGRRAAVGSEAHRAAAMSAADGILSTLKAWNGTSSPQEIVSLGVLCQGQFDVSEDIVFSIPVTFTEGKWSAVVDVTIEDELKERLARFSNELRQERRNLTSLES
ncbi:putative malate dehydrogenase 1B [Thalassophryne amazonica]|uniref:putative malate dehydrogenase 1B n=1 Tax=Thalassophryne amazonica TaxID=390379 RepID=UPI00147245C3|nr:putative malate dehydrogenase 1B [Thalassophryne amazonica]